MASRVGGVGAGRSEAGRTHRALPQLVHRILPVLLPSAASEIVSFFRGPAHGFKIHLDDTCMLSDNWRSAWRGPDSSQPLNEAKWWPTKYGAMGFIPRMIEQSPFFTTDWRAANASIVVHIVYHLFGAMAYSQQQCLQRLRQCSPSFRADGGGRHFFVMTNDRGPCCIDGRYKDIEFTRHRVIGNGEGRRTPRGRRVAAHAWLSAWPPRVDCIVVAAAHGAVVRDRRVRPPQARRGRRRTCGTFSAARRSCLATTRRRTSPSPRPRGTPLRCPTPRSGTTRRAGTTAPSSSSSPGTTPPPPAARSSCEPLPMTETRRSSSPER